MLAEFDPASAQSRAITFAPISTGPLRLVVVDFGDTIYCDAGVVETFEDGLRTLHTLWVTSAPTCLRPRSLPGIRAVQAC